ncbi:MAG: transcription-repair coupling factor [Bacteroidales bacterium]|nr:transcription-repair coupling factor [Bacteroidales bacterium]
MNFQDFALGFNKHPHFRKLLNELQNNPKFKGLLRGMNGSEPYFFIALLFNNLKNDMLVVMPDADEASDALDDLTSLLGAKYSLLFPSAYKRSIQYEQPDKSNMLLRTEVLEQLTKNEYPHIVVTYPEALLEQVISKKEFQTKIHVLHVGEQVDAQFINDLLYEFGFERVDFVTVPGQFSVRGSIIDIFSFSNDLPYRVDFFGDEIESIRTFNVDDQLSVEKVEKFNIIPDVQNSAQKKTYIPIYEYLNNPVVFCRNLDENIGRIESIESQASKVYKSDEAKLKEITQVMMPPGLLREFCEKIRLCELYTSTSFDNAFTFEFHTEPHPKINKKFDLFGQQLVQNQENGYLNYFISQTQTQYDRIQEIFAEINPNVKLNPIITSISKGFIDNDLRVCCYTDHEIFDRYHAHKRKKKIISSESLTVQDLKELNPGDFVVHIDFGIGKFAGLERIVNNGTVQEAVKLVYRDNDLVYVNINGLHKISKYKGKDGVTPTLHKLGSAVWQNTKQKTKKKVKDIAKELIALYAERKAQSGFQYSPDSYLQNELEASFFFEDTPDQAVATEKVKTAMEAPYPMDMLVCGDVGFGKTEIAIRAAFKAVADGKQVAVLVPTTILALQHYKTFSSRLKNFPCSVDYICRLRSTKQQKESLENLASAKTDIIIGTHRLVGKDVKFKDLGLLIIDEEQKFGVGIKEKLKQLKVNVDTLTLTATPIPRTLQFSLLGARDLAIINTPPPNRHPIITELHTPSDDIVKEAIMYEVERGGQVFVINNRVSNIYDIEAHIKKLCPKVRTIVGHGQMEGPQLEQIMLDFINHEYDVLIATTIIESGLDIPNANTMIVYDAHHFGLSDLHQLRGRVGRSNKKAYCYLMAPPLNLLPDDARRRLQAIEDFSGLGSGFNIAMQDLDIRGAGNLLGAEQSGFISDIGYETYQKILDEAMLELKENEFRDMFAGSEEGRKEAKAQLESMQFVSDCHIDTDFGILFPNYYIENTSERVKLYRELDNISNEEGLQVFEKQLIDRFGEIPQESMDLLNIVRLRWLAISLGIEKITLKNKMMINYFIANQNSLFYQSPVFTQVLNFVQQNPRTCAMKESQGKLTLTFRNVTSIRESMQILIAIKGIEA